MKASGKRYILVVDDIRFICDLLSEALTREGFAVQTFNNGEDAIEAIQTQIPSLIIIDYLIPGMDGLQTLKMVHDSISGVPVIMMSGSAMDMQDQAVAIKQGLIQHFIRKPFDLPSLMEFVKTISPVDTGRVC